MRVLVTGGSGRLGQQVLRELVGHGHEVVNADRRPPAVAGIGDYREVDVADVGHVAGALSGCDAVAHLGAIPTAYSHPDEVVFGNNTRATFAVLQASALLGVRRAVLASSLAALGGAYAANPFAPLYAPVDEHHPLRVEDPYGLSKEVDERIGAMFHRRTGMTVLAYRFHWIANPDEYTARAIDVRDRPERWAHELWGYVDVRDAAYACRLGIESEGLGFEVLNITSADSLSDVPTEELMRRYCPDVQLRGRIEGTNSAWSTEKAQRLLGYTPRHSWRDEQ